jgi:hypothetical protein
VHKPIVTIIALLMLAVLTTPGCASGKPSRRARAVKPAKQPSLAFPTFTWEPIGLSGGGGMFSPAISPADPDLMMLSCDMSGAYVSEDGGRHWRMIHHQQLQGNTRCAPGFHPKDKNTIFMTDGWSGLKVTHDRGRTWTKIGDLPGAPTGQIYVSPEDPSVMLTGVDESVHISRDAGSHWEKGSGPTGAAVGFLAGPSADLFAATSQGIWRSDNGGQTWVKKTEGLPSAEIRSFAGGSRLVSVSPLPGGRYKRTEDTMLYCAVPSTSDNGRFVGGIYRSHDLGDHWESAMGSGINVDTKSYDEWADGSIAQYHHVLATNANPLIVYAFNSSTGFWPPHFSTVYRSDDGGDNWRPTFFLDPRKEHNVAPDWSTVSIGRAEPSVPFGAAVCDSDPDRVLHVGGFVYATHDGGASWFCANTNLAPGQQSAVAGCEWLCNGLVVTTTWHYYVDPFQPNRHYIAYTDIGFARSVDAGNTWIWWTDKQRAPWNNTCYELAFDPDIPGKIWGAFSNVHDIPNDNIISGRHGSKGPGGVCLSTDFGESWPAFGAGLPLAPATSIVLDPRSPKGKRTLYVSIFDHGVFKSTDDGKAWVNKSKGFGDPANMRVYRLILHQDGTLFALITAKRQDRAFLKEGVGLYRSRNGGESWECITSATGLLWPKDFAVDPRSSKVIFLGAADAARRDQGGLHRTIDSGKTWKRVAREGAEHFGAYFDPKRPDWVYMTLTEGAPGPSLWLSPDRGDTWRAIETFPFANTQRVQFDPTDPDVVYVTTFGGSVFRGRMSKR